MKLSHVFMLPMISLGEFYRAKPATTFCALLLFVVGVPAMLGYFWLGDLILLSIFFLGVLGMLVGFVLQEFGL